MPNLEYWRHWFRSGNLWTDVQLRAFNIEVKPQEMQDFFGRPDLPEPAVSDAILNSTAVTENITREEKEFFLYMKDAIWTTPDKDTHLTDFTISLLRRLGYDDSPQGSRVVHSQKVFEFEMSGNRVSVKTDALLAHRYGPGFQYLLLVQEDKSRYMDLEVNHCPPEPQLIASAIAAFEEQNDCRRESQIPVLKSWTYLGIVMRGLTPIFYKIPITEELHVAVFTGTYPLEPIIVEELRFPVPIPGSDGLHSMRARKILLQFLEAFKTLIVHPPSR